MKQIRKIPPQEVERLEARQRKALGRGESMIDRQFRAIRKAGLHVN